MVAMLLLVAVATLCAIAFREERKWKRSVEPGRGRATVWARDERDVWHLVKGHSQLAMIRRCDGRAGLVQQWWLGSSRPPGWACSLCLAYIQSEGRHATG